MKNSPWPVDETPQTPFWAQVPEPIIGESPTLPGILFVMPPVEVAAEILPFLSRATAPTVPILSVLSFNLEIFFFELRSLLSLSSL